VRSGLATAIAFVLVLFCVYMGVLVMGSQVAAHLDQNLFILASNAGHHPA
jgi:hypothetical protein